MQLLRKLVNGCRLPAGVPPYRGWIASESGGGAYRGQRCSWVSGVGLPSSWSCTSQCVSSALISAARERQGHGDEGRFRCTAWQQATCAAGKGQQEPTLACAQGTGSAAHALAVCHLQLPPDQAQQVAWQVQQPSSILWGRLLLLLLWVCCRRGFRPACTLRHACTAAAAVAHALLLPAGCWVCGCGCMPGLLSKTEGSIYIPGTAPLRCRL